MYYDKIKAIANIRGVSVPAMLRVALVQNKGVKAAAASIGVHRSTFSKACTEYGVVDKPPRCPVKREAWFRECSVMELLVADLAKLGSMEAIAKEYGVTRTNLYFIAQRAGCHIRCHDHLIVDGVRRSHEFVVDNMLPMNRQTYMKRAAAEGRPLSEYLRDLLVALGYSVTILSKNEITPA